jgi:ComF family protein
VPTAPAPAFRLRPLAGQCEVCRVYGQPRLCATCIARFAPATPRCLRCAARLPIDGAICGGCLRDPPIQERAVAAADYAFPWDRLIIDMKFNGQVELAASLAELLTRAVRAAGADTAIDLVVPVPLSTQRLAERGFNQAWEIARRVAKGLGRPASAMLLRRPIDTAHQADLPRAQRSVNLRHAFLVEPPDRTQIRGRRVAVVDDVLTTGATAREAAAALLRAGAASVQVWTVARTA